MTSAYDVLRTLFARDGKPGSAMLEIADRCNEACVHCYQVQGQKGEMSTEQVCRVIDELADAGVLMLTVSGGEATLRKDLLDILQHAREREMAVTLFTNALRITPQMAHELARLRLFSVEVSLHSHRPEVHDRVTRVPGSFERTVDAIRSMVDEGLHVVVKATAMHLNVEERSPFDAFVRSLGGVPQRSADFVLGREDGDRGVEQWSPSAEQLRAVLRDEGEAPPERDKAQHMGLAPCGACQTVHIEANGEMRPCTQLEVPVGRADVEGGVARALEQDATGRFIRGLKWSDIHGCRDCDLVPYCTRCYAEARRTAGDALGPYEKACTLARARYEAAHGVELEGAAEGDGQPGRDTGPYRLEGSRLRPVPDVKTDEDEERSRRHGWIRSHPAEKPGETTGLVRLHTSRKHCEIERLRSTRSFGTLHNQH